MACIQTESADLLIYNIEHVVEPTGMAPRASTYAMVLRNDTLIEWGEEQYLLNKYATRERFNARRGTVAPLFGGIVTADSISGYIELGFGILTNRESLDNNITICEWSTSMNHTLDTVDYCLLDLPEPERLKKDGSELFKQLNPTSKLWRSLTAAPQIAANDFDYYYLDLKQSPSFSIRHENITSNRWSGNLSCRLVMAKGKVIYHSTPFD